MSNSGKNEDPVKALIQDVASGSQREAVRLPPPDVQSILDEANAPRSLAHRWVPRVAAAAAVLAAVVGILSLIQPLSPSPHAISEGPVPEHLTALVDSLYSNNDYVVAELAPMLGSSVAEPSSSYMDEVWSSVVREIGDP